MARPRQVSDGEILRTARACFLEHGPGVAISVVAERLGVSQPTLFKRFGTKEELMLAALAPPREPPWLALLARGPGKGPFRAQLRELFVAVAAYFESMAPCMMMLRASGIDVKKVFARYETPPPVVAQRALRRWLDAACAQGSIGPCDTDALATLILGALHVRPTLAHVMGGKAFGGAGTDYLEGMLTVLWRGLAPGDARR